MSATVEPTPGLRIITAPTPHYHVLTYDRDSREDVDEAVFSRQSTAASYQECMEGKYGADFHVYTYDCSSRCEMYSGN